MTNMFLVILVYSAVYAVSAQSVTSDDASLKFIATPNVYNAESDNHVELTCTFSPSEVVEIASVVSMVISRNTEDNGQHKLQEIVEVNGAGQVQSFWTIANEVATAEVRDIPQSSYLSLTITEPSESQLGEYECEVNYLTPLGHPASMFTRTTVRQEPKETECTATQLQEQVRKYNCTVNKYEALLSDMRRTVFDSFFGTSAEYNGSVYYLYLQQSPNATEAEKICTNLGGYLAEIESDGEFNFVLNFIRTYTQAPSNPYPFESIYLGARDDIKQGDWYFRHSLKPMAYVNWGPGEPNFLDDETCLVLYGSNYLGNNPCVPFTHFMTSFLCEVPTAGAFVQYSCSSIIER